jgi:hypothetical protein
MYNFGIAIAVNSVLKYKELEKTVTEDKPEAAESISALNGISSFLVYCGYALILVAGLGGLGMYNNIYAQTGILFGVGMLLLSLCMITAGYAIKVFLQIEINTRK